MSKTYVCRDFVPLNEYTTPIKDTPTYRNTGIGMSSIKEGLNLSIEDYKNFLPIFATMYKIDREKRKREQNADFNG